jgi:sec-independent protein translocase protein TatA
MSNRLKADLGYPALQTSGGRMGSFSIWHWLIVLAVILVLFGGGNKISGLMGDFANGIKSFKKNMSEPDEVAMEENAPRSNGTLSAPGPATPVSDSHRKATHPG